MTPIPCQWCGSPAAVGPCPWSLACPTCGAAPGVQCRRPSGWAAARMHDERVAAAEADLPAELRGALF